MYVSLLVLNWAVGGGEWSVSRCFIFASEQTAPGTLSKRVGATQSRSGRFGGDTNLLPPLRIKAPLLRRLNSNPISLLLNYPDRLVQ